jgi:hypothetical protein
MFLDLTLNRFSGKLPMRISEAIPILVMLRVRSNNFYGHIPVETTKLYSLRILDLANNKFSGGIPQPLVNLKEGPDYLCCGLDRKSFPRSLSIWVYVL